MADPKAPCNDCIKGTIHKGQPQGKIEKVHGLDTYVIGNRKNPRGIIVVYSDVFGLSLPNNKLIADRYAQSGEWLVYMPDFFKGDPLGLSVANVLIPVDAARQSVFSKYGGLLAAVPSFLMWSARHKFGPTDKSCVQFLQALRRATPKTQKIGMVGMCWGGRYAIRAGQESNIIEVDGEKKPLIDAVVVLHPSNLDIPADVEYPVIPMSFGWGQEDQNTSIAQKGQVEEAHKKAAQAGKKVPEIHHQVYYPGRHGFAVRGNPDDPKERACLEDSVKQVLDWFERWL